MQFLEFEKPIAELEAKIEALAKSSADNPEVQDEIARMKSKMADLMKKSYSGLSDWQIIQLARHPQRPYFLDLLDEIFDDFHLKIGFRIQANHLMAAKGKGKSSYIRGGKK